MEATEIENQYFYPRSPCGERPAPPAAACGANIISIHALLAESDIATKYSSGGFSISIHALLAESDAVADLGKGYIWISIHALLAESDLLYAMGYYRHCNFYPRSPCGERQIPKKSFGPVGTISIHALLAESDYRQQNGPLRHSGFLSTLSLRRATTSPRSRLRQLCNFYPRSPCGERRSAGTTAT